MEILTTVFNSLSSVENLLKMLGVSKSELNQAIAGGYKPFKKLKNGKYREIQAPNDELKAIQQTLLKYLQEHLKCPQYCRAGFKGQNNIKNAMIHSHKREIITTDISHCFPNTQEKYIRKFFEKEFHACGEVLELLVALTTYKGYLPTGAPTSTLLACFAHKKIFDDMYKKMQELGADMTIYVDDITISTHGHIGNWIIKYIKNSLKRHGLYIKKSKTKRYGFKSAVVTGVHISQSGKLSAPFCIGHSVVKALEEKKLTDMSITELQGIIAKISYIQQFQPSKMSVTKNRAIKQLKRLQKNK
jgi:hypothetical protein